MKLTSSLSRSSLLFVLGCWSLLVSGVQSTNSTNTTDFAVLIEFNEGRTDPALSCLPDEWDFVQVAMDDAVLRQRRRKLRLGGRHLQRSLNWCLDRCSNVLDGYCHYFYPGCRRHNLRRNLLESTQEYYSEEEAKQDEILADTERKEGLSRRHLQAQPTHWYSQTCADDMATINATLDTPELQNNLTSSCRDLINAPRNLTCLEVKNCTVEHLYLAHIDRKNIVVPIYPESGGVVCRVQGKFRSMFGAETAFCVDSVQFTLRGVTNGFFYRRSDYNTPFHMYPGNNTLFRGDPYVPVGNYTLTAMADTVLSTTKTISFELKDC